MPCPSLCSPTTSPSPLQPRRHPTRRLRSRWSQTTARCRSATAGTAASSASSASQSWWRVGAVFVQPPQPSLASQLAHDLTRQRVQGVLLLLQLLPGRGSHTQGGRFACYLPACLRTHAARIAWHAVQVPLVTWLARKPTQPCSSCSSMGEGLNMEALQGGVPQLHACMPAAARWRLCAYLACHRCSRCPTAAKLSSHLLSLPPPLTLHPASCPATWPSLVMRARS